ncbi:hypothetical protein GGI35DRAFT_488111 [Trichoderma velutinum]
MEPCHNIQQLSPELRYMIWSEVSQTDSYTQLLRTSHLIRADILALIPRAGFSCQCSPYVPCTCGKSIDVKRLTITVEPECSPQSWLKFSVSMHRGQEISWRVESLDGILAQPLRYFHPKEIFIDFQAPKKGDYHISLLILRAKVFDVCSVLDLVQAQRERSLHLHFSDPWAKSGGGPNKPFWENRPCSNTVKKDTVRRVLRRHAPNLRMHMIENREACLFFYETILTPFCMNWAWRNAKVTFDKAPKLKSTSFVSRSWVAGKMKIVHHGIKPLLLTIWAYIEHQMQKGTMKRSEEEYMPKFENHQALYYDWISQEPHHISWKQSLNRYLDFFIENSQNFYRLIIMKWPRETGLVETIDRHINLSPRNGFSDAYPGSVFSVEYADFSKSRIWAWNPEIIRQRYRDWSQIRLIMAPESKSDDMISRARE